MLDRTQLLAAVSRTLSWRYEPYGDTPGDMDCVGWTRWVLGQAGVEIPAYHYAMGTAGAATFYERYHEHARPVESPEPGDIAFIEHAGVYHMGLCLGGGVIAHMSHLGVRQQRVDLQPLCRCAVSYYRPLGAQEAATHA